MKQLRPLGFAFNMLILVCSLTPAVAQTIQPNTSRESAAYSVITVEAARRCQKECVIDGHCRAWVFIQTQPTLNCRLMSDAPPPQENSCCTSGAKIR